MLSPFIQSTSLKTLRARARAPERKGFKAIVDLIADRKSLHPCGPGGGGGNETNKNNKTHTNRTVRTRTERDGETLRLTRTLTPVRPLVGFRGSGRLALKSVKLRPLQSPTRLRGRGCGLPALSFFKRLLFPAALLIFAVWRHVMTVFGKQVGDDEDGDTSAAWRPTVSVALKGAGLNSRFIRITGQTARLVRRSNSSGLKFDFYLTLTYENFWASLSYIY